jgi:hypothetical protein
MMTSRSLICLLENQNGGKLQKKYYVLHALRNKYIYIYSYEENYN